MQNNTTKKNYQQKLEPKKNYIYLSIILSQSARDLKTS